MSGVLNSLIPERRRSSKKHESQEPSASVQSIQAREYWPHHMDFILSCVGYAVGFGSIWRFPYLCMRNGGGAFVVAYIIFMLICGVPLFFMELSVSQFSSATPLSIWKICPLFQGLGWSMIIVSGIVCIYYNVILTWVIYYLVMSMKEEVPWKRCGNTWNTCLCLRRLNENATNATSGNLENATTLNCSLPGEAVSPAEEFWKHQVLGMSSGIDDLGGIKWELLLCLAVAWLVVFACLCKGVKSVGKVVYVTATSPYIFMIILLVRNVMLEGSWIGVKFYMEPKWSKLLEPSIWAEAALQVFYSLGPGWGGLITLGSFNKFHNNCYRDAMIVPLINCVTALFGGFVIFSVIGHMAHLSNLPVEKTLEAGPGITFVAYPEAITNMPFSPIWAILFFLMLITIGLDTQFGMFETMTSSFVDQFPRLLRPRKVMFTGLMCLLEFLIALPLVTRGGVYIFTIMDWYCGTFALTVIVFLELVITCGIYGINQFRRDIKSMIGFYPSRFWNVMWMGVTPLVLIGIFFASVIRYENPKYGDYEFPNGAIGVGWCLGISSLIPIPAIMIYKLIKTDGTFMERVRFLLRPTEDFGPAKVDSYDVGPEKRPSDFESIPI